MHKSKLLSLCLILAFSLLADATQRSKPKASIDSLLGKSLNDEEVRVFLKDASDVQIASFPTLRDYYYSTKNKGVSLMFNDEDRLVTIFLFSDGIEGYKQFTGLLPHGLAFRDTRSDVTKKLGLPARSGGGDKDLLGKVPIWDKYRLSEYSLHISYRPTGNIERVTLMEKSADPDLSPLRGSLDRQSQN